MLCQPQEQATTLEGSQRKRVLIVEDDHSLADALAIRLTKQGFVTTIAHSGHAALGLAHAEQPNVMLLDLGLPDLDGLEVCERIVDDELTRDIPVIIVSGKDDSDVVRQARAAGCSYFLHKPYDPNALLTLIERAIDESQQP